MSFHYIASPYSTGSSKSMEQNYNTTCDWTYKLIKRGYTTLSPIVLCHPIAVSNNLMRTYKEWLEFDHNFLDSASGLIIFMMEGWQQSVGVQDEVNYYYTIHGVDAFKTIQLMGEDGVLHSCVDHPKGIQYLRLIVNLISSWENTHG